MQNKSLLAVVSLDRTAGSRTAHSGGAYLTAVIPGVNSPDLGPVDQLRGSITFIPNVLSLLFNLLTAYSTWLEGAPAHI